MGSPNKETRKLIFSTLRKIEGHIRKMSDEVNWLSDELSKVNEGIWQTGILLQILNSVLTVMRFKIGEELDRPGYKKIKEEENGIRKPNQKHNQET